MINATLRGPFRIFYQNKPVRINGTPAEGLSWEHVKDLKDASQYETLEAARAFIEAIQFASPRQVEICPLGYTGKDQMVRGE